MLNLTKAKALAVGVMLGFGVAAPLVAWQLEAPRERLDAARHTGIDSSALAIISPDVDLSEPLPMEELVVSGAHHQMLAEMIVKAEPMTAPAVEPEPEKRCHWHQSETLALGAVMVCDVERTPSGQTGSLFAPSDKPTKLAPRDVPSPSGFVR